MVTKAIESTEDENIYNFDTILIINHAYFILRKHAFYRK